VDGTRARGVGLGGVSRTLLTVISGDVEPTGSPNAPQVTGLCSGELHQTSALPDFQHPNVMWFSGFNGAIEAPPRATSNGTSEQRSRASIRV
jgi:hypothetical protein